MKYESKFGIGEVCYYVNTSNMSTFSFETYVKENKDEQKEYIKEILDVISSQKITDVNFEIDNDGDVIVSYNTISLNSSNFDNDKKRIYEDFAFKTMNEAIDYLLKVVSKRVQEFVDCFNEVKKDLINNEKQ